MRWCGFGMGISSTEPKSFLCIYGMDETRFSNRLLSLFCPKSYANFCTLTYLFYRCAGSSRRVLHGSQLSMESSEPVPICSVQPKHTPPHALYGTEEALVAGLGPGVTRHRGPGHQPGLRQRPSEELTHTEHEPVTLNGEDEDQTFWDFLFVCLFLPK